MDYKIKGQSEDSALKLIDGLRFKDTREILGLTANELSQKLGVNILTVKKMEDKFKIKNLYFLAIEALCWRKGLVERVEELEAV